jgi:hypothetical protein
MAHVFDGQKRSLSHRSCLISLGTAFLMVIMIASTCIVLMPPNKGKTAHAARSTSSSFIFTAAGDYSQTNATTANMNAIRQSGASLHLALGDFSYSSTVRAAQWSNYVKSLLPPPFPFEIIPGDHDAKQLSTYAASLPDRMGSTGTYARQYYFDYPPGGPPLARFIMISPGIVPGYTYTVGGSGYNWVATTIDAARAANIPWVIVGMYKNCFSLGSPQCSSNDILNLLVSKKVDLILYAHKHNYEASKQLAFNGTTCTSLTTASYNASCVVNATPAMAKGAGSVIVITGTGGAPMIKISTIDPARGYFRTWEAANSNQTWGISQFTVSTNQLAMQFVGTSGGSFTDSFTITGGTSSPPPSPTSTITVSPDPSLGV